MTPDEIRALKPGPELDREVAETLGASPRVEWYLLNADESAVATSDFESEQKAREYHSRRMSENPTWAAEYHVGRLEIWPRFSETWPGLGLVVEEMERRGYLIDIDVFLHRQQRVFGTYVWRIPPRPCGNVECIHGSCQPSRVADYESADRFEAACKAALLALAAEKGQRP